MTDGVYKLDDLARRASVSARTVRYYVQRGLVPAPAFRGPDTAYGEEHLAALLAVKRLQEDFWPLDAIAGAIAGRSIDELHRIAEGKLAPKKPAAEANEPAPRKRAEREAREPSTLARSKGERVELAQGLTLWIDEEVSDEVQRLAQEIVRLATRERTTKKEPAK